MSEQAERGERMKKRSGKDESNEEVGRRRRKKKKKKKQNRMKRVWEHGRKTIKKGTQSNR